MAWAPATVQRMPVPSRRSLTRWRQAPSARAPTVGWSAADGIAGRQVFVVAHVLAVVFVVANRGRQSPSFFSAQIMLVAQPLQAADTIAHFPFQQHPQAMRDELLGLVAPFGVEAVGCV